MKEQRLDSLEQYILDKRSVTIDSLCDIFHVSKNTVRRDLDALIPRGNIIKVYGGVKAAEPASLTPMPLSSFEERHIANIKEKEYICHLAAPLVSNGDIIYIDTGTTCVNLVEQIRNITCTIITNSLQAAALAVAYETLTVIMLPGKLKRETLSFVGLNAVENLSTYNIDKAFMASTGVTIENGMTNASSEEYAIKKMVMERSSIRYLLADHDKFGRSALHTFGNLDDVNAIITDRPLSEKISNYCTAHNIKIIC